MNGMRRCRLRAEIPTVKEAAKLLGMTESAVGKMERGIYKPKSERLPLIAKTYKCTIEELLAEG